MTIVLRSEKGTPLTSNEVDGNFIDLDGRVSTAQTRADNAHTLAGQAKTVADAAQVKLVAGSNITIDVTDPTAPVISASGGGGTGAVQTVAGVAPVDGDVPSAGLITALGIDGKLPSGATAVAAQKLATARTINGQPFDGTANISITDNSKEPAITAGTNAQFFNGLKQWVDFGSTVRATLLTGLSLTLSDAVAATDSVLSGIGKLQKQITDLASSKLGINAKAADSDKLNGQLAAFYTSPMTGATASADGTKGLVPAPAAGATRFLSSLGTWLTVSASAAWGSIAGSITDQLDLKSALDAKLAIAAAFGMGQAPTIFNTGRVLNTNYTNSTGKTILVSVATGAGGGSYQINDVTQIGGVGQYNLLSFAVPNGSTYKVTGSLNSAPFWNEYR